MACPAIMPWPTPRDCIGFIRKHKDAVKSISSSNLLTSEALCLSFKLSVTYNLTVNTSRMFMGLEKFWQLNWVNWTDFWVKSKLGTEVGSSLLMSGLHQKKKNPQKDNPQKNGLSGDAIIWQDKEQACRKRILFHHSQICANSIGEKYHCSQSQAEDTTSSHALHSSKLCCWRHRSPTHLSLLPKDSTSIYTCKEKLLPAQPLGDNADVQRCQSLFLGTISCSS